MIRDAISAALFAKLAASAQFVTASRRLRHWSDTNAADQPALFLVRKRESVQTTPGLYPVSTILWDCYLYVNTGSDSTVAAESVLNPLIDAVQAALAPDNAVTNKQTLGGLVQHVWIEGAIECDEGVLGPQGVAIIPIVAKVA